MPTPIADVRPERRRARPSALTIALAVLGAGFTAFATLCPIDLRPHLASANHERFAAYFVLGALIALAAQRRWLGAMALVGVLAFGLEAGQMFAAGRHAVLADAVVKALGGIFGCVAAQISFPLRRALAKAPSSVRLGRAG